MTPTLTGGDLSSTDVDELIAAATSPVVAVFGTDWCPPCHTYEPVVAEVAAAHPELVVRKVDVDRLADLVVCWSVASAPTTLVFVDGELRDRWVGARSRAAVLEGLAPYP